MSSHVVVMFSRFSSWGYEAQGYRGGTGEFNSEHVNRGAVQNVVQGQTGGERASDSTDVYDEVCGQVRGDPPPPPGPLGNSRRGLGESIPLWEGFQSHRVTRTLLSTCPLN